MISFHIVNYLHNRAVFFWHTIQNKRIAMFDNWIHCQFVWYSVGKSSNTGCSGLVRIPNVPGEAGFLMRSQILLNIR